MFNPSKSGWLTKYLSFRKTIPETPDVSDIIPLLDIPFEQEYLYRKLQPTGLMYGYPVALPNIEIRTSGNWFEKEKMKIILTESFLTSAFTIFQSNILNESDRKEFFSFTFDKIGDFYSEVLPESEIAGKNINKLIQTEKIIDNRVSLRKRMFSSFWANFFHNSLLFLDVFYFDQWLKNKEKKTTFDIISEKEQIRLTILQIIAAAAHANGHISDEEKSLFSYFLDSSGLNEKSKKEASEMFYAGITLDQIELKKYDFWLLNKYMLELALLTIWSDKTEEEPEKLFIEHLVEKTGLDKEDMLASMAAIETFIVLHWEKVNFLSNKHDFSIATSRLTKKMSGIFTFYKSGIKTEFKESKELVSLLIASMSDKLNEKDREKVKLQLQDLLKSLPIFVLLALPGRTVSVPFLMSILPKKALPTGFQD